MINIEKYIEKFDLESSFIVTSLTFDQRMNFYRKRNNGMILNFDSIERVNKAFDELNIPKYKINLDLYLSNNETVNIFPSNEMDGLIGEVNKI